MSPVFAFALVGYLAIWGAWIGATLWAFARFWPLSPYAPGGLAAWRELARWTVALLGLHLVAALLWHSA